MSLLSPRLALPYLAEAQAQKHVTVNESLRRIDALVHLAVKSVDVSEQPSSPAESDAYILPAGATGEAWSAHAPRDIVVFQDGAWEACAPVQGMHAYAEDEGISYIYDGAQWRPATEPPLLGVNASADSVNRLSVKSDAVLISHDDITPGTGDVRLVLNKSSAGGTASILFQTAFSGKAEFGLTGKDDFVIKVADDSGTFRDAIVIDRQTGAVSFPNTP